MSKVWEVLVVPIVTSNRFVKNELVIESGLADLRLASLVKLVCMNYLYPGS